MNPSTETLKSLKTVAVDDVALFTSIATLVQTLSARFMQARPHEELVNLAWMCEQLGHTLSAEVVAVRDLDAPNGVTTMAASWGKNPAFRGHLDVPLRIRGEELPTVTVVARNPKAMPIVPPCGAARTWVREIGGSEHMPCTFFCPLLDGDKSTGFLCLVLPHETDESPELVALLSSVTAVVSQFRKRVAAERLLRQQMDFTALQGRIAERFAMARCADSERVLTDALRSVGEHLGALSLSMWKLEPKALTLTRQMRWLAAPSTQRTDGEVVVQLSASCRDGGLSFTEVSPVSPAMVDDQRKLGALPTQQSVQDVELWSVPITANGKPKGCLMVGLLPGRSLREWEALGLRAIAALVPVIKSRFVAEDHLTRALATSPTGVTLRDEDGRLVDCNEAFCDLLGFARKDLLGTTQEQFVIDAGDDLQVIVPEVSREVSFRHSDGRTVWGRVTITEPSPLQGDRVLCHVEDITIERAERSELLQQAHFDKLTGLPNRHGFADIVSRSKVQETSEPDRAHRALLMVDINDFKGVNDRFGHCAGDIVLQEVSARLQASIRGTDCAIRYGGDEFVILLEGPLSVKDVLRIAEHLHVPMAAPIVIDGQELQVTLSIGATLVWGDLATEFSEVLHRADVAMYRAKDRGHGSSEILAGQPVA